MEPEIKAMEECYQSLNEIEADARVRVIKWLSSRFNLGSTFIPETTPAADNKREKKTSSSSSNDKQTKTRPTGKSTNSKKGGFESYSLDRNLDLRGGSEMPSFKEFYNTKRPISKAEFNTVAVYYLKVMMNLGKVGLDQVYTCYKEASVKPPDHFKQSFRDTKSKEGFIEYDEQWLLSIPLRGQSFVEHDLPKKIKSKK